LTLKKVCADDARARGAGGDLSMRTLMWGLAGCSWRRGRLLGDLGVPFRACLDPVRGEQGRPASAGAP
jgi:hypothetical protein